MVISTEKKKASIELPTTKPELKVSRYLLQQLEAWGVQRIYGVIGDAIFALLDEIARQSVIQFVPCRHEEAAALMASAESKLTGRLSVCMATSGPGMAKLLDGLADAAMDRTPVLAITGQVPTSKLGTNEKQYIDQQALIHPIAEQTRVLTSAQALPKLLNELMVSSQVRGIVAHLSIPMDLYNHLVPGAITAYPKHLHQKLLTPMEPIEEAARLLSESKRPVLYIGKGVAQSQAEVKKLATSMNAAVITTMPAFSYYPNDDALFAGGLGQAGSEASSILLRESDLLLILGATWWPEAYTPSTVTIVQVDRIPQQIGINHSVRLGVVGDLADVLPKLLSVLGSQPDRAAWREQVSRTTQQWKSQIEAEASQETTPMAPQRVMKIISDIVSEDAIISVDTGDHTLWFERIFQTRKHEILISGHWRTLGFALPSAIAAKLTQPQRQSIAIVGDGAAVQTMLELQTASHLGVAVTMIIIDNGSYAMEKNRMEVGGMNPLGSNLVNPDFCKIAEACGAKAFLAENSDQLVATLKQALSEANRPTLIQVKTRAAMVPHTKP